jgi:hypothetical protein
LKEVTQAKTNVKYFMVFRNIFTDGYYQYLINYRGFYNMINKNKWRENSKKQIEEKWRKIKEKSKNRMESITTKITNKKEKNNE